MADDIVERLRSVVDGRQYTGPYWKYPLGELICDAIFEIEQLRAAGSPPPTPAPTAYLTPAGLRRLVEGAIFNALPLDVDRDAWAPKATDAVMALLPQPAPPTDELTRRAEAADAERDTALDTLAALSAPPLWTATTEASNEREYAPEGKSYLAECLIPVPPGTAVEVREKQP